MKRRPTHWAVGDRYEGEDFFTFTHYTTRKSARKGMRSRKNSSDPYMTVRMFKLVESR